MNIWDWTAPFYTLYYKDANGLNVFDSNVPSPFVDDSNNGAPNTEHLETAPPDYLVADGWELLYKNIGGYLPSSGRTEYVDVPSFALYNRYTGLVRTLVYHPTDNSGSFQLAEIRASHWNRSRSSAYEYGSAVFSNLNTPALALDAFYGFGDQAVGYNVYNDGGIWSILDYVTAYDPCVCQSPSKVYVETAITETQSVELNIEGSSNTEPIVQAGQPVSAAQRGFGIASNILGTAGSGIASFGNVQKYNAEAATIKSGSGKDAILTIASNLVPGWFGAGKSVVDLLKLFIGSKGTSSRIVGYTTAYELEASGEITGTEYGNPSEFNTPSSQAQNSSGFQTGSNSVYGNPLGVINLVKTPEVTRRVNNNASATGKTIDEYYSINGNDLEYVVNTSAGFLPTPRRIMMSLVFEDCIGEPRFMRLMPASTGGSIRTPFADARCFENQYANFYSKFTQSDDPNDPFGGGGGLEFEENECTRRYLQVLVTLIPADGSPDVVYMGSYEVKDGQTISVSSEQPFSGFINDQPASSSCAGSIVQPVTNSFLQSFCTSEYDATRVDPRSQVMPLIKPDASEISFVGDLYDRDDTGVSFTPNPFRDHLKITAINFIEAISIINSVGQEVLHQEQVNNSEIVLLLDHLPPGVYSAVIISETTSETKLVTKL